MIFNINNVSFLHCPFCGEEPELSTEGSCIDISCCASMSFQKSDYMTLEERNTWTNEESNYSNESEYKVLKEISKYWNQRF